MSPNLVQVGPLCHWIRDGLVVHCHVVDGKQKIWVKWEPTLCLSEECMQLMFLNNQKRPRENHHIQVYICFGIKIVFKLALCPVGIGSLTLQTNTLFTLALKEVQSFYLSIYLYLWRPWISLVEVIWDESTQIYGASSFDIGWMRGTFACDNSLLAHKRVPFHE